MVGRARIREFVTFFGGSAVGLVIDLVGFSLLILTGLVPWQANAVSSSVALTAVYFLVVRFTFSAQARVTTYVAFFAWYGGTIVVFSVLIQAATTLTDWPPLICKLASIPISFGSNYLFSRYLFRPRHPTTTPR
ncbi:GtrA family protein [Cryobacterium sp. CG_9.6]|uniref:GtrA family protein n=1 Tax=Cryobacterium sp. CG_9.6 TaxID=2760710 RepID=UPI0024765366|nr:GtrA family protein [Cryobacterium sp. CG_9.6]MDH6235418.1 putative flippase GtrA [Cryobacterium sp. CG_9.6]